ncbi:MAG: hypothetical protein JWQ87_5455 [Candidatus Sulfotelmatobacter sp.]|nr:hypothetical protein [Candidatus Sulfotelmatobacter sp.]
MSEPTKHRNIEELLVADINTLTVDEMTRRQSVVTLMKAERELEVVNEQNRRFQDDKETRQRQVSSNLENIRKQDEENARVQKMCRHKTGGKDRQGFFMGDGDVYGFAVSKQILPTGEIYGLCFRCQKEWHNPIWTGGKRKVVNGEMTLAQYVQQEREYKEMLSWTCKTFEGQQGELPGGHMFLIPNLQRQQQKDQADFEVYLKTLNPTEIAMSGYQLSA